MDFDCVLEERELREVQRIKDKLTALRKLKIDQMVAQNELETQVLQKLCDILVECGPQRSLAWIRMPPSAYMPAVGSTVLITNLKPVRSAVAYPLLVAGGASSIHTLRYTGLPETQMASMRVDHLMKSLGYVDSLATVLTAHKQLKIGQEISFCGTVIDFVETVGASICSLDILIACSTSDVIALLRHKVPKEILALLKKDWLNITGVPVVLICGLLLESDICSRIVSLTSGDHTRIHSIQTRASTLVSNGSSRIGVNASSEANSDRKLLSSICGWISARLNTPPQEHKLWAENALRWTALRSNLPSYTMSGLRISCERTSALILGITCGCCQECSLGNNSVDGHHPVERRHHTIIFITFIEAGVMREEFMLLNDNLVHDSILSADFSTLSSSYSAIYSPILGGDYITCQMCARKCTYVSKRISSIFHQCN